MSLSRQRHHAIWSPNAVGKVPECFTSLLMNIWATQQLTLSDHIFFSSSCCCCCAWCGSDVFIRLSKRKCLQLWRIPLEPVTLLVSMAVLQAAPQAGCVQGPIQPVFSAAAPLMFSPRAGVKLPSAETERERTLHPFSVTVLCCFTRKCIAKKKKPSSFEEGFVFFLLSISLVIVTCALLLRFSDLLSKRHNAHSRTK